MDSLPLRFTATFSLGARSKILHISGLPHLYSNNLLAERNMFLVKCDFATPAPVVKNILKRRHFLEVF